MCHAENILSPLVSWVHNDVAQLRQMQKAKRETLLNKGNQGRGAKEKEGECVNVFVGFQREHCGTDRTFVICFYADKTHNS